jgi:hypothetical protein
MQPSRPRHPTRARVPLNHTSFQTPVQPKPTLWIPDASEAQARSSPVGGVQNPRLRPGGKHGHRALNCWRFAPVAQGIEQRFPKPRVGGSNPSRRAPEHRVTLDREEADAEASSSLGLFLDSPLASSRSARKFCRSDSHDSALCLSSEPFLVCRSWERSTSCIVRFLHSYRGLLLGKPGLLRRVFGAIPPGGGCYYPTLRTMRPACYSPRTM